MFLHEVCEEGVLVGGGLSAILGRFELLLSLVEGLLGFLPVTGPERLMSGVRVLPEVGVPNLAPLVDGDAVDSVPCILFGLRRHPLRPSL